MICLPEKFLDHSIPIADNRLSIPGYHFSNTKGGRACLYYKEHFSVIQRDDISHLKNA